MADTYTIFVRNGRRDASRSKDALKSGGFRFDGKKKTWSLSVTDPEEIRAWKRFGRRHGLSVTWQNDRFARGSSCRSDYFAHNPPAFGDRYLCIYCGLPIKKENVQVDHIYPVAAAKQNPAAQRRMDRKGWEGVNDYRNLGASCARCNRNKSDKTGLWVVRGRLGTHKAFQAARWCVRAALMAAVIAAAALLFLNI